MMELLIFVSVKNIDKGVFFGGGVFFNGLPGPFLFHQGSQALAVTPPGKQYKEHLVLA